MKNRDRLMKMCLYDLLVIINNGVGDDRIACIIEIIENRKLGCLKTDCNKCIAEWLNKEESNVHRR